MTGVCLAVAVLAWVPAGGVPRSECFPVDELSPAMQDRAERLLLKVLDNEGLYTVVTGLKPVSEGFWSARFDAAEPDLTRVEEVREALKAIRCGDAIYADVLVFRNAFDGKRYASAYVVNRPALRRLIERDRRFWAARGVTPNSHPAEVMMAAEYADEPTRFRGLGYLFGYPRHAVDFFVEAAGSQKEDGKLVPRDFVNVPTFELSRGRFVYAVPKGHEETAADRAIRKSAGAVLAAYMERRSHYIGDGKAGPASLLRDWYAAGTDRCHPANAVPSAFKPPAKPPAPDRVPVLDPRAIRTCRPTSSTS